VTRVVLVPGVLALLPEYAGLEDPVADLRAACLEAVGWLGPGEVTVLADPRGERVARALLAAADRTGPATGPSYLVVGNGSACRTEKAPGHLDERAEAFDAGLGRALRAGTFDADLSLADELLADVGQIARLGDLAAGPARVDYDDDPFGVQYWVMRWEE
jgi:hypothetical protein